MEGNLGILYVCGEETGGKITTVENLLGRKVRRICGAYDRFVALVDAWELEWSENDEKGNKAIFENHLVAQGLQDVKVHYVAIGKNHRVALSLDGQLFSWGRPGEVIPSSELGHQLGMLGTENFYRAKTPGPEVDETETRRSRSTKSFNDTARNSNSSLATATGVPHRVVTAPELFFTQVSCGEHHSVAVTDNGDVYTWGRNFEGQLGHVFKTLPKDVNAVLNGICAWPKYVGFFLGKPRVVSACCGNTFTAVLLADGSVYLLGGRSLRPPSSTSKTSQVSSNTLTLVLEKGSGGEPFVGIACGFEHILAVSSAGEMFSWGLNTFGQLGHGGKTGRGEGDVKGGKAVPHAVSSDYPIKWAKVFAGGTYSAAITTNHELYTWGNGSHGKLGHGKSSANPHHQDCEFVPRRVDYLKNIVVGSVVCADRNLFAFAPTYISRITPLCGEHTGGYELRIQGSGFWSSDNITVRFVPLTDGRLLRGTLGTFCEATGEVVCPVPKFRLSGEFLVEVSMNGKHFTSNGRIFTVFKRPHVAAVSVYDARFAGGEELTVSLCGSLPEICRHPIVRLIRFFDEQPEIVEEEETEHDACDVTGRLLRFILPALPADGEGIVPYTLEISYDGGLMFVPVCVDPTLAKQKDGDTDEDEESFADRHSHSRRQQEPQPAMPHVIWVHDAKLLRTIPNSFLMNELPQTITLELQNLLPLEVAQLLVTITHFSPNSENGELDPFNTSCASTPLTIDRVEGNFLTCKIPRLTTWQCTTPSHLKAQGLSGEWWKAYTKTGFMSQLRVSMNFGRTFLPAQLQFGGRSSSTAAQVFSMPTPGRLLSLFPNVGMVPGGTQVSVAADFFHFDTQDAAVKLRWRESSVVVPAVCLRPEESTELETNSATRRVVFRTPPLPFPDDSGTAAAMTEGMVLGTREEVEIFVSLDGDHFTDAGLKFVYCAVPEMSGISPLEAEPGTKMVLAVDKVVPVEIDEAAHTAEFVLPELPCCADEVVQVAVSLNGQEFTEGVGDPTMTLNGEVRFQYKIHIAE
ncbi:Regulator of chromosome condensation (RCC1)-like protein [Phytophthora palmivora]|uniref:Regulator of chromosome condensation (RCC1)-like protein n=1 Tax=Phytophthora palmivora TaxID=4796 RepID=A0A2P4XMK6_9STRA|nr:Regulator of chromosome condensation (RCC1)-like protein [Phytophthora palmivora]